jgi:hypothetical protein
LVSYGQVGIGTETPDASAALEILSTEKGLLISRMSESQKLAIPAQRDQQGLIQQAQGLILQVM